jgi:O-antigen/teichoic acid export membrane protein
MLRSTTFVLAGGALALYLVTTALATPLLQLFGDDFTSAVTPLRLLAVGQLVVLAGGPVTVLLVMVGGERDQARAGALAGLVLLVALVPLVPAYGASGAAAAASIALIVNKIVIVASLRRRIGKEAGRGDLSGRVLAVG